MSRFYVPKENVGKNEIIVRGKEARHILDVMRLRDNDKIVVFDGTGKEYAGFIKKTDKRSRKVVIEIIRVDRPSLENTPEVTLAQAIPKKDKMDYIVEKATELGVARIIPLVTDRTIVRPGDAGGKKKIDRWRKKAIEASKQCGRRSVPDISEIRAYKDLLGSIDQYDLVLMACLAEGTVFLKKALTGFEAGRILVFIGPEGDFTPEEMRMADKDNCKFVSLGRRVLRSDTAGLFVLAALNYEFKI